MNPDEFNLVIADVLNDGASLNKLGDLGVQCRDNETQLLVIDAVLRLYEDLAAAESALDCRDVAS